MKKSFIIILLIVMTSLYSNTVKDISYSVHGVKEYALLSIPDGEKPHKGYPLIVIIHGYIPPAYYSTTNSYKGVFNRYANSEFMVVKPDLIGHGRSEKGENYNYDVIKLQYTTDIKATVEYLDSEYGVDNSKIFVMGHSNGGDTTLRLLTFEPEFFRAASLWAPVSVPIEEASFFFREDGRENHGMRALESEAARVYVNSVKKEWGVPETARYLNYLDRIVTPVTIRHASSEKVVPYYWSEEFISKIKKVNNDLTITLIDYHGDDHNLAKNQKRVIEDDLNWFRTFLNP